MINRLTETAEKLRSSGAITDDDVILLKQSRVARNILQEETLGDINRVSDKTVTEILDEVRLKIRKEEQEKFALDRAASQAQEKRLSDEIERERQTALNAKKSHEATLEELKQVQDERENIKKHIETLASHIALGITITFYVISFAVVVTVIIAQFYPDIFKNNHILYTILIIIAVIFTAITILTGLNIWGLGRKLKSPLKQKIVSILLKNKN
jgi:Fe2+ transport system protein B